MLRDSTPRFVGPSVRWSVRHTLLFFVFLRFLASLLLPKWWSGLKYGPCPPARNLGSRVSGLVHFWLWPPLKHKCCLWKYAVILLSLLFLDYCLSVQNAVFFFFQLLLLFFILVLYLVLGCINRTSLFSAPHLSFSLLREFPTFPRWNSRGRRRCWLGQISLDQCSARRDD